MNQADSPSDRTWSRDGTVPVKAGFLLAGTLFALPLLAAHAPLRIKLIGLFPIAIAMAGGGILLFARPRLGISGPVTRALAVALVPMMMAVYAWESWHRWRSDHREMIVEHLEDQPGGAAILDALRSETPPKDATMRTMVKPYRKQLDPPPAWYLEERLSGLPFELSTRGRVIFMAAEWVIAVFAGIGFVLWNTRRRY